MNEGEDDPNNSRNNDTCSCNVKVVVRIRPLVARERLAGARECLQVIPNTAQIMVSPEKAYTFDAVAGPEVGQAQLFSQAVIPVLDAFGRNGHNATILAYGQTGSGKTFTMGTGLDVGRTAIADSTNPNDNNSIEGIVPRAIEYLFRVYLSAKEHNWDLLVSFLEIYNEEIIDLLNPASERTRRPVLTIREDPKGDIYIAGIREEPVRTMAQVMDVLGRGSLCRTTKSTDMNLVSSRSHAIFSLILRQQRSAQVDNGRNANVGTSMSVVSKLHFVDLAGSERLKRTNALGARVKESISINSGLLALGNVISALGDDSKRSATTHVPYRDSKLTRLLQDALGGNSRTLMIACVSPSSDNYNETVNTLKYAHRTRNIRNTVTVSQDPTGSATFEIMQLRKQVQSLKHELLLLRTASTPRAKGDSDGERFKTSSTSAATQTSLNRRIEQLLREKAAVEAERDHYRVIALQGPQSDLLQTMAQLKGRIAELEAQLRQQNEAGGSSLLKGQPARRTAMRAASPSSPEPVWMNKTNCLIEKARLELQNNLRLINGGRDVDNGDDEDDGNQRKSPSASKDMAISESEFSLKEELLEQLQTSQQEYLTMRGKYEERLRLLQENLATIQRERDGLINAGISNNASKMAGRRGVGNTCGILSPSSLLLSSSVSSNAALSRAARIKYEERIKMMGRELNELKAKLADLGRTAGNRGAANEQLIRNLKASLQTIKLDRDRLAERLDQETNNLRTNQQGLDSELRALRQREYKATEGAKKWRRACELQKALLQKKAEQYQYLRGRIKTLLGALRRQRIHAANAASPFGLSIAGVNLDSPSWHRIIAGGSGSGCTTPQVPSRLGGRSVSAEDSIDDGQHCDDDEDERGPLFDGDVIMSSPGGGAAMKSPFKDEPTGGTYEHRRPSFDGQNLQPPTTPGQTLPRSVLRMSPLLPRRGDFLARIAAVTNNGRTVPFDFDESTSTAFNADRTASLPILNPNNRLRSENAAGFSTESVL